MSVLPSFAFFRSVLGIRGRRKHQVRVHATLVHDGTMETILLNERGEPDQIKVKVLRDTEGKKWYSIFGPAEKVEAQRLKIESKLGPMQWDDRTTESLESFTTIELPLISASFRRLAAKIAYERFAQLKSSSFLNDSEYHTIRDFIRHGTEGERSCWLLGNPKVTGLSDLPMPNHAVVLIAHPKDRILGGFVTFFGLFYYWVVLSRRYRALAPWDDLLVENPQRRETDNPLLRSGTGSIRVPWMTLLTLDGADLDSVVPLATQYATDKFRKAVDSFYEGRATHFETE